MRIAIRREGTQKNLLIVGDWFVAETVTPRPMEGYLQTNFTKHASTVLQRICDFDDEFEEYLSDYGFDGPASCDFAIGKIREIIKSIKD